MSTAANLPEDAPATPDVFGRTYTLLRWGMPMLLLWLVGAMVATWMMVWLDRDEGIPLPMTSISAYYYTDAQPVFVGVLIGLGVLLIVIEGRTPWEDALMNTAGALAPFVALLPTPVKTDPDCTRYYCTAEVLKASGFESGIPNNNDLIDFNVWAVAPVWALLVAYLTVRAIRTHRRCNEVTASQRSRNADWFSSVAVSLCGVTALGWWLLGRESFYLGAHLTAAGTMVGLLLLSIIPFTRFIERAEWADPPPRRTNFLPPQRLVKNWFGVYFVAAMFLLGVCIAIVALKSTDWNHFVLVIEGAALLPFAAYWIFQGIVLRKYDRHTQDTADGELQADASNGVAGGAAPGDEPGTQPSTPGANT